MVFKKSQKKNQMYTPQNQVGSPPNLQKPITSGVSNPNLLYGIKIWASLPSEASEFLRETVKNYCRNPSNLFEMGGPTHSGFMK
jgi:hypothetical protein